MTKKYDEEFKKQLVHAYMQGTIINGKMRYNCTIINLCDRCAVVSLDSNYINTKPAIDTLKDL